MTEIDGYKLNGGIWTVEQFRWVTLDDDKNPEPLYTETTIKQLIQDKYVNPLKKEIERIKGGVPELENPKLVIEHHENQLKNFEELLEELEQ